MLINNDYFSIQAESCWLPVKMWRPDKHQQVRDDKKIAAIWFMHVP